MSQNLPAIPPEDRITYAEARRITGRSTGYLIKLANEGRLTRVRGERPGDTRSTWLSRAEVEALAIAEDSQRRRTTYWCTVAQAAETLGVSGQTVHNRLPPFKVSTRRVLVRADDVARAAAYRRVYEQARSWPGGTEKT